jgi:hypothetical protein
VFVRSGDAVWFELPELHNGAFDAAAALEVCDSLLAVARTLNVTDASVQIAPCAGHDGPVLGFLDVSPDAFVRAIKATL